MLKLTKRHGSPYYYIRGTLHGRSIYASTKERDKAGARRFKTALEIKLAQSTDRKCNAATFQEAAALYLEFRRPQKYDWVAIERLCAVIGGRLLADIRQHVLVDAANIIYPHCSPETQNRKALMLAAAVLHYAAENDLCPYIRVKKLKEKRPEPRAMRKEDAARLIAAADGKLKLLLVFLFSQGWRISDALRLQWQDINFAEAKVRYHIAKTDEWRETPLHLTTLNTLRNEAAQDAAPQIGRVFPWRGKTSLYRVLQPLCRKAAIFFTPHMARHSFATWLNAEGASTKEIMEAGGWRDHKSVMRYTHVDERRVRATINRIKI
jgi:integrase